MVLGLVKKHLPHAQLPIEGGRVAAALATSLAAGTAVRALTPRSALAQETGTALAALIPAVLVVRNSSVSGYHGAEHKVIGAREEALRAAARSRAQAGDGAVPRAPRPAARTAPGRLRTGYHGPYRRRRLRGQGARPVRLQPGRSLPDRHRSLPTCWPAAARAEGPLCARPWPGLPAWASLWKACVGRPRTPRSPLARAMMLPGRALQKSLTTSRAHPGAARGGGEGAGGTAPTGEARRSRRSALALRRV